MKSKIANLEYNLNSTLGEGPMWHPHEKILYWVDITEGLLHLYNPRTKSGENYRMGSMIGTVVPHNKEGVVVTLETGIYHFKKKKLKKILDFPERESSNNRFNDGKCDSAGRFWIGTMDKNANKKLGSLYSIEKKIITKKLSELTISNGICWLKDFTKMFFIDSEENCVLSFDYNIEDGSIENTKVIIMIDKKFGTPDGMTIDEDNNLWIALWGGSSVIKCNPFTGKIIDKIEVDVPNVTSCTFGGENLSTLFITTAREGLTESQIKKFPLSGSLFSYTPNVKGLPANSFVETIYTDS